MTKTKSKPCPGSKIRSGGSRRGLGRGKGKGLLEGQLLVKGRSKKS